MAEKLITIREYILFRLNYDAEPLCYGRYALQSYEMSYSLYLGAYEKAYSRKLENHMARTAEHYEAYINRPHNNTKIFMAQPRALNAFRAHASQHSEC